MANVYEIAPELVQEKFDTSMQYAQDAVTELTEALSNMSKTIGSLTPRGVTITIDTQQYTPQFGDLLANKPTPPDFHIEIPAKPGEPSLIDITLGDLPQFPTFDIQPVLPVIPPMPSTVMPTPPGDTPELDPIVFPTKPTYTLPSPPGLITPSLPASPNIVFPVFDAEVPNADSLIPPVITIDPANAEYASPLLTAIKEKLLFDLQNGGTGLSPEIENAIWAREYERTLQAFRDQVDRVLAQWSRHGFSLPNGDLAVRLRELEENFINKRLDASRDIAIKQAELEQSNLHHVIQQTVALEQSLMSYSNQIAQRTFDASRAVAEGLIKTYEANIQKFNILNDIYKARAAVYEAAIRAEGVKAEVYRAQVEGVRAVTDVNESYVKIYTAQVESVESLAKIYSTEMQAAGIMAEVNKTRMEAFKALVDTYLARVNAKTAEYNMYQAQIAGETAKVEIYRQQVEAFKSQVQANAAIADAKVNEVKAKSELNKDQIQKYLADIEAWKTGINANVEVVRAEISGFQGEVGLFQAEAQAYGSIAQVEVEAFRARITQAVEQAKIYLAEAEMEIKEYETLNGLAIEAQKAAANVMAHFAAGALSGVNASAGISSTGASSHQHEYDEKEHVYRNYNYG